MERIEGERRITDMNSKQVNLLVSLLIRFPQMSAVHYEPRDRSLRFVYLLKGVQCEDLRGFAEKAKVYLQAFHSIAPLTAPEPRVAAVHYEQAEDVWVLQMRRDVDSLTYEEVNLINELVQEYLGKAVVCETVEETVDDEFFEEDMAIDTLLSSGGGFGDEKLSGYREKGRVLVFSNQVKS